MSHTPTRLRGIVPPLVTPLSSDDQLDVAGLERLIEHVLGGGVHGLFVLGTTGEGPSLSYALRREMIERTCRQVNRRIPVLVGITDTSREESLELAKIAADCGAFAVVAAPPYYFPITQSDLATYFVRLADESPLPLFVYNMPACCHVSISRETFAACTQAANIAGIKDSGGDLEFFKSLLPLRDARPDWSIFIGPESLTADATLAGGDGGVNGGANLWPQLFVDVFAAAEARQLDRLARLQRDVQRLGQIYSVGRDFISFARSTKCALELTGLCSGRMAPPFEQYDETAREQIVQFLLGLGLPVGNAVRSLVTA